MRNYGSLINLTNIRIQLTPGIHYGSVIMGRMEYKLVWISICLVLMYMFGFNFGGKK